MAYVGRFAPSPTGPLHFGSLVAAVASYADALAHGGRWLVRMEDVDEPRTIPGAASQILRQLEGFGFEWHGEIVYQSHRKALYQDALDSLKARDLIYPCVCSRRKIAQAVDTPSGAEPIYPGFCRHRLPDPGSPIAWRLRVNDQPITIPDRWQGQVAESLSQSAGDFVLLRADGYFAYQLAVVVDDQEQGVTDVVRGQDLLTSVARQVYLQRLLGYRTPRYLHVPLATNEAGEKLSKQTKATAIDAQEAPSLLAAAWRFLGQPAAPGLPVPDFWRHAAATWTFAYPK